MKSAADRFQLLFTHLLLIVLLPACALAAQARSSMEVSVQVVRRGHSPAPTALIAAAGIRDPARAAINSDAECKSIGNMVVLDGALATCSWDSESHAYLVTAQY